VGARLSAPV